jgi:hypothetical protein
MRCSRFMMAAGAIGVLTLVGILGVIYRFPPAEHAFYPQCLFHALTGCYCPGCGTLRAVHHLLHGQIAAAMHANALAMMSLVLCLGFLAYRAGRAGAIRLTMLSGLTLPTAYVWAALGIVVAFGVVRNLPGTPFVWLAP